MKAKLYEIFWSCAKPHDAIARYSGHFGRNSFRVWTDHLDACQLAQTGGVRKRGSFHTSQTRRQIEQHRFRKHISVRGYMKTQRCWQIGRAILPTAERDADIVLCRGTKAETERTDATGSTSPSLPKVSGLDHFRLGLFCVANPEQLQIAVCEEETTTRCTLSRMHVGCPLGQTK